MYNILSSKLFIVLKEAWKLAILRDSQKEGGSYAK